MIRQRKSRDNDYTFLVDYRNFVEADFAFFQAAPSRLSHCFLWWFLADTVLSWEKLWSSLLVSKLILTVDIFLYLGSTNGQPFHLKNHENNSGSETEKYDESSENVSDALYNFRHFLDTLYCHGHLVGYCKYIHYATP